MSISPQRLTIYLYSTHRAFIFAIAQLSCSPTGSEKFEFNKVQRNIYQPLFQIYITSSVESAFFFIPSTSFFSLSSWFHLILRISPHHSHHLRSHHISLPRPFTPVLKFISFINPFTFIPSGLPSRMLACTELKGHCFVCFSFFFFIFFLATCARLTRLLPPIASVFLICCK